MERMNIECDKRAGDRRRQAKKNPHIVPEPSVISYWQLSHQGNPIVINLQDTIRLRIQEYEAFEYWTDKNYNSINKEAFYDIYWDGIEKAMTGSTQYKRQNGDLT